MEEIDSSISMLKSPANFVIAGSTGSGKTMLVYKLLHNWPFPKKLGNLIYFYNVWQDFFEQFLNEFPNIKFIQGLSEKDIENRDTWKCPEGSINVCVCDDLVDNAVKSDVFGRLFTVYGHHWKIINIFITQNLFFKVSEWNSTVLCFLLNF